MGRHEGVRQEHLDDLVDDALERGVDLEVDDHGDHLWLGRIERTTAPRGMGAVILQDLLDMADDWDLPVRCAVDSSTDALIEWYVSLAFEIEAPSDIEGGRPAHSVLVRNPERMPSGVRHFQLQEA